MNEEDILSGASSEFVSEIKDDLEKLETDLLTMEESGGQVSDDLVNHAFRAIHSIKGGAGFLGLQDLSEMSHSMENVLMMLREKKLLITPLIVDALLAGFDKIRLMADAIGSETRVAYAAEKAAFERIVTGAEGAHDRAGEPQETAADEAEKIRAGNRQNGSMVTIRPRSGHPFFKEARFSVNRSKLEQFTEEEKFVYAVYVKPEDLVSSQRSVSDLDKDIHEAGELLFSDFDRHLSGTDIKDLGRGGYCIVATILDANFLEEVLEVPEEQIYLFDEETLFSLEEEEAPETVAEDTQETDAASTESMVFQRSFEKAEEGKGEAQEPTAASTGRGGGAAKPKKGSDTVRINVDLITRLMGRAGELVLTRNQLRPFLEQQAGEDEALNSVMQNLNMVTTEIQEDIMQMRMQPVDTLFKRFKRVVRDTARQLSKKVDYYAEGGDTELDRNVLENLINPFTHLIRNCVDHGIEPPEQRAACGKPEQGTIHVKAFHQGGHVHILISDDGAGIDAGKVAASALEKGIVKNSRLEVMTEKEKMNLIFSPGFSTSDKITDVSGRGVGMDVVKSSIEKLRGNVEVDAAPGEGTRVQLIIPLTLAIVPALIVETGGIKFAVPHINVSEVLYYNPGDLNFKVDSIKGSDVLKLRDKLVPIIRLRNILNIESCYTDPRTGVTHKEKRRRISDRRQEEREVPPDRNKRSMPGGRRKTDWDSGYIVILKVGFNAFGLCVDDLHDSEEIVVEPLSDYIKDNKCFSGATIMGDGKVVMILDASGIASFAGLRFEIVNEEQQRRDRIKREEADVEQEVKNVLVFRNSDSEYFGVELHTMTRLEMIPGGEIKSATGHRYMAYNKRHFVLFTLDEFLPASPFTIHENRTVYVLIPKNRPFDFGIVVPEIRDAVDISEIIDADKNTPDAVSGKFFMEGVLVQLLNMEAIVSMVDHKETLSV